MPAVGLEVEKWKRLRDGWILDPFTAIRLYLLPPFLFVSFFFLIHPPIISSFYLVRATGKERDRWNRGGRTASLLSFLTICARAKIKERRYRNTVGGIRSILLIFHGVRVEKCPWKIECFLEDLFLGSQWSIILGYIWLSVKFFLAND